MMERLTPKEIMEDIKKEIQEIIDQVHDLPITGYGDTYKAYLNRTVCSLEFAIKEMKPQEDFDE